MLPYFPVGHFWDFNLFSERSFFSRQPDPVGHIAVRRVVTKSRKIAPSPWPFGGKCSVIRRYSLLHVGLVINHVKNYCRRLISPNRHTSYLSNWISYDIFYGLQNLMPLENENIGPQLDDNEHVIIKSYIKYAWKKKIFFFSVELIMLWQMNKIWTTSAPMNSDIEN